MRRPLKVFYGVLLTNLAVRHITEKILKRVKLVIIFCEVLVIIV